MILFPTGKLPIHTGLQHYVILSEQPSALPLEFPTLPETLKEGDYSTHLIAKIFTYITHIIGLVNLVLS